MTTADRMQAAMEGLDEAFNGKDRPPRTVGIVLLTFPFGTPEGGRVNYVNNGERDSVRVALKELLARWEGRYAEASTKQ